MRPNVLLLAIAAGLAACLLRPGPAKAQFQQRQQPVGGANQSGVSGSGSRVYPNSTQVGEAMITSDPATRNLIIVTDDETNLNIKDVIARLDQPKPQVLINVVFLQVTHNKDLDLGVEGSFTHNISDDKSGAASTDFGIESAASILAGGGFYRYLSDDLDVTLRALAVAGRTEVLSRPTILARNNQQATIIVGQEVPLVTNTRITDQDQIINTVQYEDIGIILRVTPFITPDGMVEMIVTPEISSLSDETVFIGNDVSAPVIDKRAADTVVLTPSGKTVVIGGLMATQNIAQERKVPVLGDIPLLGFFFRRTIKQDTKTELMIFLTPEVILHPGDVAKLTQPESRKLKYAPESFKDEKFDEWLRSLPEAQPEPATEAAPASPDQP